MMLDMHPWVGLSDDVRLGVLTEWVTAELVDEGPRVRQAGPETVALRGAGNNRAVSTATASSFLNCPGVRGGTGWSLAWPERVVGVAGPLADLAALVSLGLPGVPGPLQLRG